MAELYESIHTGAEIDDAVERAKVGGEIDAILNAAEYSSAQTYALGDYCKHTGKLYRCTTAITEAEAWTEAHWTETSVTAELIAIYTSLQNKADKDRVVNQNLLVNWYFGNPVNQRGQTSYTGAGYYSLDGWFIGDIWTVGKNALSVNDGYITLQEGLFQRKELKRSKMNGRVLSLSALFADGTLGHGVIHMPDEIVIGTTYTDGSDTANGCVRYISEDILEYRIEANGGQYVAVKLELGDQQTLAHQENGVWVLNEIPDYGEQLARCQRYFQLYSSADIRPAKAVDCRPTMRADPAQGTVVVNGTTYYYNNADL